MSSLINISSLVVRGSTLFFTTGCSAYFRGGSLTRLSEVLRWCSFVAGSSETLRRSKFFTRLLEVLR